MPIKVLELHHHGIRVDPEKEALAKALEFYGDVLGLKMDEGRPSIPGVPGYWMYVGRGEDDGQQASQIHLMGVRGISQIARSPEEDPTLPHVALAVENITEAEQELEKRGVAYFVMSRLVGDESRQIFVKDPFGNVVELHQIGTCRCNRNAFS